MANAHKVDSVKPMEIFPWNPFFDVGVDEIDVQHKNLVGMINSICRASMENQSLEIIDPLFNEVIAYTKEHFLFEESFFEANGVPASLLADHKEAHGELVQNVALKKEEQAKAQNAVEGLDTILTMLVLWLTNHILKDDARLCLIVSLLRGGTPIDKVEALADEELQGSKESVSKVMLAMVNVSNASFRELRAEIKRREELELELKEEIRVRKSAEKRLKHLAGHDALTDLPNRMLFEELCDAALRTAKRAQFSQAVLFIDIDGFKKVNDRMGHKAGDELLVAIARRLQAQLRDSDLVARLGGDEFIVHLGSDLSRDQARAIADKIVKAIDLPFQLEDGMARVGASIGVAMYPQDADTSLELVKSADVAMYAAKKSGKGAYQFFGDLS